MLLPTGDFKPSTLADPQSLRGFRSDDGYTNLIRDSAGKAEFWLQGNTQKIRVRFGPKYYVGIVFAPTDRDFVCFEPMTGVTNAINLAHAGLYGSLQSIPPGGSWKESFWIAPEGF